MLNYVKGIDSIKINTTFAPESQIQNTMNIQQLIEIAIAAAEVAALVLMVVLAVKDYKSIK